MKQEVWLWNLCPQEKLSINGGFPKGELLSYVLKAGLIMLLWLEICGLYLLRQKSRLMQGLPAIHRKMVKKVKPFLKWAGGKGQLLTEIEKYYSFENGKIIKYAEPFVGGGAVLFDILSKYDLEEVYISDINAELVNTYRIIRDDIDELVTMLMQDEFVLMNTNERKIYYISKRERFNDLKINGNEAIINIEKAVLMIFLNKTCFNGLFRVNKKGLFNVPIGSYKNPMICDESNLRAVSKKLQKVNIVCGDYRLSKEFINENTFVYFDPPYRPLTDTASFTAYTENLFNDDSQRELADYVNELNKKKEQRL